MFSGQNVVDIGVCSKWALEKNVYSAVVGWSSLEACVCVCARVRSVTQSCPTGDPMVYSQALLSMGFYLQEYWSGLPFPPLGESSQPRDQSHVSCVGRQSLYHWATWEAHRCQCIQLINGVLSSHILIVTKRIYSCISCLIPVKYQCNQTETTNDIFERQ